MSGSNGEHLIKQRAARRVDETAIFRVAVPEWQDEVPREPPVRYARAVQEFSGTVFRCASLNASAIASLPLRIFMAKSRGSQSKSYMQCRPVAKRIKDEFFGRPSLQKALASADDIEEVTSHPFLDLWQNVNPFFNGYETVELMVVYLELTGNAYTWIKLNELGTPMELWTIPSHIVEVVPSRQTLIGGYKVGTGEDAFIIDPENVIHQRYPNPKDQVYGMGKLEAAWIPIQLRAEMETYEISLMRNQAVPQFILWTEKNLPQSQIDSLNRRLDNIQGSENAGKTQVYGGGLRVETIGFSQKDMMMIDRLRLSKVDICNVFGVPISKLESVDVNRANAAEGDKAYREDTVKPIAVRIEQRLNQDLIPLYGDNLFVAFDDPVPQDKEDRRAERTSLLQIATVNEIRMDDGLPEVDGGDDVLVPTSVQPITRAGEPAGDGSSFPGANGGAGASSSRSASLRSKAAKSPACRQEGETNRECMSRKIPEIMNDNPDMTQSQAVAIAADMCRKACKACEEGTVKQADEVLEGVFEGRPVTAEVRSFAEDIAALFLAQGVEVIGRLRDDPIFKALKQGGVSDWLFSPDDWIDRFEEMAEPHIDAALAKGLDEASDILVAVEAPASLAAGADAAAGFSFDLVNPQSIDFLNSYRATLSEKLWGTVNRKTLDDLAGVLQEGIIEGANLAKMTEGVERVMDSAVKHRSFRIATTEHARAVSAGTEAGYIQSRVVESKEWLPAFDACQFCLAVAQSANAQLGATYADLGDTVVGVDGGELKINYAPVHAPPLHPHCRCTLIPVVKTVDGG